MAAPSRQAGLTDLPKEMIDQICSGLSKDDIKALRLTSRLMKANSDYGFVVAHFQVYPFMITQESLQELVAVSKNERIGPKIKELQLFLVTFSEFKRREITGNPISPKGEEEESGIMAKHDAAEANEIIKTLREQRKRARRRKFGYHQVSQHTLRKRGLDVELLAEALANLPALESFTITDGPTRQGEDVQKFVVGMELASQIGIEPPTSREECSYCWRSPAYWTFNTHAFAVSLGAFWRSRPDLKGSFKIPTSFHGFQVPKIPTSRKILPAGTPAASFCEDQLEELARVFSGSLSLQMSNFSDLLPVPTAAWSNMESVWVQDNNINTSCAAHQGSGGDRNSVLMRCLASAEENGANIFPRVRRLTLDYGIDASTGQIKGIFQKYRNTLESFTWLGWHSEWYDGKTPSQYEDILSKAGEMLKMVYLEVEVPAYWVDLGILASVAGETPFQFQERRVEALNLVRGIQAD